MRLLFRGSTEETRSILEFCPLLFFMETCDCDEDLGDERDLWDSELQELPPEDPLPSLIWFLPFLTWSQVCEA